MVTINDQRTDRRILCAQCNKSVTRFSFYPSLSASYTGHYRVECHGEIREGKIDVQDFVSSLDGVLHFFEEEIVR